MKGVSIALIYLCSGDEKQYIFQNFRLIKLCMPDENIHLYSIPTCIKVYIDAFVFSVLKMWKLLWESLCSFYDVIWAKYM